jgi:hypothetical protein
MADSLASGLDAVPRRQLDAGAYERRSREGPRFATTRSAMAGV